MRCLPPATLARPSRRPTRIFYSSCCAFSVSSRILILIAMCFSFQCRYSRQKDMKPSSYSRKECGTAGLWRIRLNHSATFYGFYCRVGPGTVTNAYFYVLLPATNRRGSINTQRVKIGLFAYCSGWIHLVGEVWRNEFQSPWDKDFKPVSDMTKHMPSRLNFPWLARYTLSS